MVSANFKVGSALGLGAISIYLFTMYHLKAQAPGDLEQMVRFITVRWGRMLRRLNLID